ncbi:hypothetical protein NC651_035383 [Populus alba x Populus x berolinensis]|nr:hypothetical protein NC651_035383 [Populus alba x Populus x berolinensis]
MKLPTERGFTGKHGMLSSQELGTFVNLGAVLNIITVTSHESEKFSFNLFGWSGKNVECLLRVSLKNGQKGCSLQLASQETIRAERSEKIESIGLYRKADLESSF